MKSFRNYLILSVIGIAFINQVYADKWRGLTPTTKSTTGVTAGCTPGTTSTQIELNNVRALIHTGGDMWWDLQGNAKYEIPKNSGKQSLFAGSIWIGGVDVNGQLKLAAMRYRANGVDYWPGPLITTGAERGTTTPAVCAQYDKHFDITKNEVQEFVAWFNSDADTRTKDFPGYSPPAIITDWPAHGDVAAGYSWHMAPFADVDGDDYYDPLGAGDYPMYELYNGQYPCGTSREDRQVRLYGDQTLWWVYNDRGNIHTETQGDPIGMEIKAQAFVFSTSDELNNMTFYNYELINRSTYTLTQTYFGVWTDADMGYAWDDYVGCDVQKGLGYLYNGLPSDEGVNYAYGGPNPPPPAIGVDFFEGPYQDPDGIDNGKTPVDANGTLLCDGNILNGNINGLNFGDGIIDNERWGMRRFIYFNNTGTGAPPTQDPSTATEHYNFLLGIWKDNTKLLYGGTGHVSGGATSTETDFMFPGTTDNCGWGQGGIPMPKWDEYSENNTPYDRRFVQSAGPFTLEPGMVNDITTGIVWARATSGDPYESVKEVKRADVKAQKLFEACFQLVEGPQAPELDIVELENELIFHIWNKKTSNNYLEQYLVKDELNIVCPTAFDCDLYYRFQGYQVFQLKNSDVSVGDIRDASLARIVYQCDIKDGVGQIVNYVWSDELGANVPTAMVAGSDNGVTHSFRITEDQFATGDKTLINHKTYYYLAIAYGYNDMKNLSTGAAHLYNGNDANYIDGNKEPYKASRTGAGGAIKTYAVTPHNPAPEQGGTVLNSTYGYGPKITQLEGYGNAKNVLELTKETLDSIMSGAPWQDSTPTYENGFGPIDVKVINPLNVPDKELVVRFDSITMISATGIITENNGKSAKWYIYEKADEYQLVQVKVADTAATTTPLYLTISDYPPFKVGVFKRNAAGEVITPLEIIDSIVYPPSTVYSDQWINVNNEQLFPEWGISISINKTEFPGENNIDAGGYLSSSMTFTDITKPWLYFLPDEDIGGDPQNWIRSGTLEDPDVSRYNDYGDDKEYFEKILDGTWAPYLYASHDVFGPAWITGHALVSPIKQRLASVDIVITSDKTKWTRCPVFELSENDSIDTNGDGEFDAVQEGPSGVRKFDLRNAASVDKNGVSTNIGTGEDTLTNEALSNYISSKGMGWFPGYAVDVETGDRLNMAFGENSWLSSDKGNDMIWNPSSRLYSDLYYMSGGAAGDVVFGGMHYIYVFGHNEIETTDPKRMWAYDAGKEIVARMDPSVTNGKREVFRNAMWTAIPLHNSQYSLLDNDVTIKIRMANPYKVAVNGYGLDNPKNFNYPMYSFNTSDLVTVRNDNTTAKNSLDLINVVPNPYYGYSEYEQTQIDNIIKITNLPQTCTISIFTLNGTLIRRFKKDSPITELEWDLKNTYGISIASGIYIIHIDAPGIGEKILKWFGVMRPIDLQSF
ncbi:MAG: hypothetical protein JXR58_00655 [Bacteroidales bacterium]|nr:hypothetical protein [Bacteroidales bacterium]